MWDMIEDRVLFSGKYAEDDRYYKAAHIQQMVALLGPPPKEILRRGRFAEHFFTAEG